MMKKCLRLLTSSDAQALAEFAVVFPVQLLATLGIIQFALVLVARDVVNYAAHTAARAELVGEDSQQAAALICSPITGKTLGRRQVRFVPGFGGTAFEKEATYGSTISFPDWPAPIPAATGVPPDDVVWPGWGPVSKSGTALTKTHTAVIHGPDDDRDFVEVTVLYEYELPIPMINWVFSSHRIAGSPHLGIVRTARVPKPWVDEYVGKNPHPVIADME